MKILAIPATNSRHGRNRQLVVAAAAILERGDLREGVEVEVMDLNDYEMPLYSIDRQEASGFPAPAHRFLERIAAADRLVISFAEHNGSYSVAWKNVYDWASRINVEVYQGRRVAMFATAPGGRGGAGVLEHATLVAPFFGAEVSGSLAIPNFDDNFDSATGELTNADLRSAFVDVLRNLVSA